MDGILDLARRAAEEAGILLMSKFGRQHRIEGKAWREFVTEADLESEDRIRSILGTGLPGVPFIGEEGGAAAPGEGEPCWLVDPLDGTANYAHGYPFFSVSIAFVDERGPAAACVHDPVRGETFTAAREQGSFLSGRRISVSAASCLEESILATGFPYRRSVEDLGFDVAPLLYLLGRVRGIRRSGSAALDLSYVACGRLDGFWEEHLRPWDMAAGVLLVKEAGGLALGWGGRRWTVESGGALAAAPGIMDALLEGMPRV